MFLASRLSLATHRTAQIWTRRASTEALGKDKVKVLVVGGGSFGSIISFYTSDDSVAL